MKLPRMQGGRLLAPTTQVAPDESGGIVPQGGVIRNNSSSKIWIVADDKKHCLGPGESSSGIGIDDADGLLLDGRNVLFDSLRTDLGGGTTHSEGAIKVCTPGSMTVSDGNGASALVAEVSVAGFICPGESAGYHDLAWCNRFPGWNVNTAPTARNCT